MRKEEVKKEKKTWRIFMKKKKIIIAVYMWKKEIWGAAVKNIKSSYRQCKSQKSTDDSEAPELYANSLYSIKVFIECT